MDHSATSHLPLLDSASLECRDCSNFVWSVKELVRVLGFKREFLRRRLLKFPGVLAPANPTPGRRIYRPLRIPHEVALRFAQSIQIR